MNEEKLALETLQHLLESPTYSGPDANGVCAFARGGTFH